MTEHHPYLSPRVVDLLEQRWDFVDREVLTVAYQIGRDGPMNTVIGCLLRPKMEDREYLSLAPIRWLVGIDGEVPGPRFNDGDKVTAISIAKRFVVVVRQDYDA